MGEIAMDLMYRVDVGERFSALVPSHSLPRPKALHHQQACSPRRVRAQRFTLLTTTTDNNRHHRLSRRPRS